jgi:SRSO17 transposase
MRLYETRPASVPKGKQGTQSPGVQRQYTGSAGKIANCQIGVSLCIATATEQVPIDFELYLPKAWTDDVARRERAPDFVPQTLRSVRRGLFSRGLSSKASV